MLLLSQAEESNLGFLRIEAIKSTIKKQLEQVFSVKKKKLVLIERIKNASKLFLGCNKNVFFVLGF